MTGGSGGQGMADAGLFAAEGAAVVLADVDIGPAREAAGEIPSRRAHARHTA